MSSVGAKALNQLAFDTTTCCCRDFQPSLVSILTQLKYMPFDPAIKRTEATLKRAGADDSQAFKVIKGAPHIVLSMCANATEIAHLVDSKVYAR